MAGWAELPSDLFEAILPRIRRTDLQNVNLVNKHWHKQAETAVTCWRPRRASLDHSSEVPQLFPNLSAIDFENCCDSLTDRQLAGAVRNLSKLGSLTSVSLACCTGISVDGLMAVGSDLPHVRVLNLKACASTGRHCSSTYPASEDVKQLGLTEETLCTFGELRQLDLSWNPVDDATVASLTVLTDLESLQLKECVNVSDDGVEALASLQNLKSLNLSNTQVTENGLMALGDLDLEWLSLAKCGGITDDGLFFLSKMTSLQRLDLSMCHGVTSAGLELLKDLPNLKALYLTGCKGMTPKGLSCLASMKQVEVLNLRDCVWVDDDALQVLGKCERLQALSLRNCPEVTDNGLQSLAGLPLRTLNLRGCVEVTDKGARLLSWIPGLEDLDLSYCSQISDYGVSCLSDLQKLKRLILNWCSLVTGVGLKSLRNRASSLTQLSIKGCHLVSTSDLFEITSGLAELQDIDYELCQCTIQPTPVACGPGRLPSMSRIDSVGCFQEVC